MSLLILALLGRENHRDVKQLPDLKVETSPGSGSGFVDNLDRSLLHINKVEFNSKEGHTGRPAR